MKTLKLLGAARYMVMASGTLVERGKTANFDDDVADKLLGETVPDRANHFWPVWEDVTKAKVSAAPAKRKRTRRTKAQMAEAAAPVESA